MRLCCWGWWEAEARRRFELRELCRGARISSTSPRQSQKSRADGSVRKTSQLTCCSGGSSPSWRPDATPSSCDATDAEARRRTQTHAGRMQACTAQGLGKDACAHVHGRACEGRWGGVGVPATRRRRGRCPRAASCTCRSRCCRGAAPVWSTAAKSSAWAASGWKGTASRWGLRRWAPPHECGEQPHASRCSLMSPWWPAMARPRRPL